MTPLPPDRCEPFYGAPGAKDINLDPLRGQDRDSFDIRRAMRVRRPSRSKNDQSRRAGATQHCVSWQGSGHSLRIAP